MGVKIQWNGLSEFRDALSKMPEHLSEEAAGIVEASADGAARTIQANYPTGPTGNLKRGVRVSRERNPAAVRSIVRSSAPHAFIFEKGTNVRRTDKGYNRGRMPAASAGQAAIPVFIRWRAQMVRQLIALLERAGFKVAA